MRLDATIDASKLRVVDLRSILVDFGVPVPRNARKAALVEAFEEHVRPRLSADTKPAAKSPAASKSDMSHDLKPASLGIGAAGMRTTSVSPLATPPVLDIRFSDDNPFQASTTPKKERSSSPLMHDVMRAPQTTPPTDAAVHTPRATPPTHAAAHTPRTHATVGTPRTPYTRTPQQVQHIAAQAASRAETSAHDDVPSVIPPITTQVRERWRPLLVRWALWMCAGVWLWYCWRTRQAGYCDTSTPPSLPLSAWDALTSPPCTPCPPHAVCAQGQVTACKSADYMREQPWQAQVPGLAQSLPLAWRAERCVPDTYKLVLASDLADAMVEYLAEWHGQVRCQRAAPMDRAPAHKLGRIAVSEMTLRNILYERVMDTMDYTTFSTIWDMATAGLLEHAPHDMMALTSDYERWFLSPRAKMPVLCRLRLYVLTWLLRHRTRLLTSFFALALVWYVSRRVQQTRTRQAHIAAYAQQVWDRLHAQADRATREGEPRGLPVTHLRDSLLPADMPPRPRQQVWAHVAKVVERNANVRARQAQWHGEWQRVWEWIGMASAPATPTPPAQRTSRATTDASSQVPTSPPRQSASPAPRASTP